MDAPILSRSGKAEDAIDNYNSVGRLFGIRKFGRDTVIKLSAEERKSADDFMKHQAINSRKQIVGIHPGASWPAKMWPAEKFAALADRLFEDGRQVIIFSGPKDRVIGAKVLMLMKNKAIFADNLPLRLFSAVVSRIDGFISNDNGAMHIAAAFRIPLVGIFGPGDPAVWFPYKKKAVWLKQSVPCWPCRKDHCDDLKCMKALGVKEVYMALKRISGRKGK